MTAALLKAHNDLACAKLHRDNVLRDEYPFGAPVRWARGGHMHVGVVVVAAHYSDRLKVRNTVTGAEYWIHAFDILEATRLDERTKRDAP